MILELLNRYKFLIVLCVVFSGMYIHFFENRAHVNIEVEADSRTYFEIYWAGKGEGYAEKRKGRVRIFPGVNKYVFFLTDMRDVEKIRIDPMKHAGNIVIRNISIHQEGLQSIVIQTPEDFAGLAPLFQIGDYNVDTQGLSLQTTGIDPQLEYKVNAVAGDSELLFTIARIVLICVVLTFLYVFSAPLFKDMLYVPFLLAGIFVLILVMSSSSKRNVHPDEYVHLEASQYYQESWLPPVIEDPQIRHTYSVYGVSRLNKPEVYYFFAGKFSKLLSSLHLENHLTFRFFNVFLFGIILLYAVYNPEIRAVAVPFLLTPQLWYIFSYCDSDSFSLFICFLVSCQLLIKGSFFEKMIQRGNASIPLWHYLYLGSLCALLLLSKKNYFIFIAFGLFYFLYRLQTDFGGFKKKHLFSLGIILSIGILFAGARIACDYQVNGFNKKEKISVIREQLADPLYKPSTDLAQKHVNLYRKARGESFQSIIKKDRWFEKTFRSAFGVYGYFTVSAEDMYYDLVRWVSVIFLLFFSVTILLQGSAGNRLLFCVAGICSSALITASFLHSWTGDFQPQGRYLFPIIPIISIVYYQNRDLLQPQIFRCLLLSMFALSLYSFVFSALKHLPQM
jgi:hypothetical protein